MTTEELYALFGLAAKERGVAAHYTARFKTRFAEEPRLDAARIKEIMCEEIVERLQKRFAESCTVGKAKRGAAEFDSWGAG